MRLFDLKTDDSLKSLVSYGSNKFQFECFLDEIDKYVDRHIGWHWHNEFEFMTVTHASVDCLIGDERINLKKGESIFINSGVVHRFESAENGSMICVVFAAELISPEYTAVYEKFILPVLSSSTQYILLHSKSSWEMKLVEMMNALYRQAQQSDELQELRIQILATSLWELFYQNTHHTLQTDERSSEKLPQARLHKMLNYIHINYDKHLTIESIAAAANISKSEALRCFHLGVQTTPVRYVIDYRLKTARRKLISTTDPISEVARSVGFKNLGYFDRVFKKEYGMNPLAFRKHASA